MPQEPALQNQSYLKGTDLRLPVVIPSIKRMDWRVQLWPPGFWSSQILSLEDPTKKISHHGHKLPAQCPQFPEGGALSL